VVVLPGAGGVQPELFYPPPLDQRIPGSEVAGVLSQAIRDLTVINPRGFRSYVRNETFFQAIPLVLERQPRVRFLCPAMAEEPRARRWVEKMGIAASVGLLPTQTRLQMAELFRGSRVTVSAATHDGTPNTLLESMACGCLPVAGDIESIREWVVPGLNGLLFDPADAQALAQEILRALEDEALYRRAGEHNAHLIAEKAQYPVVMAKAQLFYESLISSRPLSWE